MTLERQPFLASPAVLLAFVVAACLSVAVVGGLREWGEYDAEMARVQISTENVSHGVLQHFEDSIDLVDASLSAVIDEVEAQGAGVVDARRLDRLMRAQVSFIPRLRGLFAYDANGDWIASSEPVPAHANNADRAYFQAHRISAGRAPIVSGPLRSRSGGQWIVTISRRFNQPDGTFAGVVLASIDSAYFSSAYRKFDVGSQGSVALLNDGAELVARWPEVPAVIGRIVLPTNEGSATRGWVGTRRLRSLVDGTDRITTMLPSARFPFSVAASVGASQAVAHWRSGLVDRLGFTAALTLSIALLGIQLWKQFRRRQKAEAQLATLAATDGLTGLVNRRGFDAALHAEWKRAAREGRRLGVILVDVDHFKVYNDTLGHVRGDDALRQIAAILATATRRPGDVVARYGGEEFVLLLPGVAEADLGRIAEQVRARIEALGLVSPMAPEGRVTASLGYASTVPRHSEADTPDGLVERADRALYRSKRAGRNAALADDGRLAA